MNTNNYLNNGMFLRGVLERSNKEQPLKDMDIKNSKLATIYEDNNLYILDIEKSIKYKNK
jgi:hypothetical protein